MSFLYVDKLIYFETFSFPCCHGCQCCYCVTGEVLFKDVAFNAQVSVLLCCHNCIKHFRLWTNIIKRKIVLKINLIPFPNSLNTCLPSLRPPSKLKLFPHPILFFLVRTVSSSSISSLHGRGTSNLSPVSHSFSF